MTRSVFQEAPSLSQIADLALPEGAVPAGAAPVVAVAVTPRHPSNAVLVQIRRDGGPAQPVRGVPEATPFQEGAQWFRAVLPHLEKACRIDYRVELTRAGQRLAILPADGSWLTMIGDPDTAAPSGERSPAQATDEKSFAASPRWAYDMTFFAALTAKLRPEVIGETPEGYRINLFIQSGRIVGPRIHAVIRPDGGDWMCIRPDGIGMVDIRITYEMAGGAVIYDRAGGIFDLGSDGHAKVAAGQFVGCPPYYATPTFVTAHPDWQWLNRCQGFGFGRVVMEELRVECDIYIPQVLERRSDG
ncbi:MAG: DUF3237 domain-containing protein [Pseudonocardiaceae bacterium]